MADRFFHPEPISGDRVRLVGDEARHLARSSRVPVGGRVELFDGRGRAWTAEVVRIGRDDAELVLLEELSSERRAPIRVTLAVAFPKGDRADWLVEKATEIGVERLVPLLTERSVVDPGGSKLDRLRRTVVEASKQCGRSRLMEIAPPVAWPEFAAGTDAPHRWLCHPGGVGPSAVPVPVVGDKVVAAVGPEGGFTEEEVSLARGRGWGILGLGATILRVETAALAGAWAFLSRRD